TGVDLALGQNVVGVGESNVGSTFGEAALHGLQKVDGAKPSQERGDSVQELCDLLLRDDDGCACSDALELFSACEEFMSGLGSSLLADVERTTAGVEYRKPFAQIGCFREYFETRDACQRQADHFTEALRHRKTGTHASE